MWESMIATLVASVCYVESTNNSSAVNIKDGGSASYGYCQMKYTTARWLGFKGHITDLWFDKKLNMYYAEKYIRYQLNRYKDIRLAVASYNTGSVKNGVIKNKTYVDKVMRRYNEIQAW